MKMEPDTKIVQPETCLITQREAPTTTIKITNKLNL